MKNLTEFLKYEFTDAEIADAARDLAHANRKRSSLEQKKKEVDSAIKAEIEQENSLIGRLSNLIATGFEYRDIEVRVELDTPHTGMKRVVRLDTGEEVSIKIMTDSDRQMVLDLKTQAEAEEAARNPAPEPIVTPPPYVQRIDAPGVVESEPGVVHPVKSLRLLREITSDIPGDWLMPGIYTPEKIQLNPFGAVSIITDHGLLGIEPCEMEWIDNTDGAPLAPAAVMGGTHQRKARKPRDAKREAAADGSEDELD